MHFLRKGQNRCFRHFRLFLMNWQIHLFFSVSRCTSVHFPCCKILDIISSAWFNFTTAIAFPQVILLCLPHCFCHVGVRHVDLLRLQVIKHILKAELDSGEAVRLKIFGIVHLDDLHEVCIQGRLVGIKTLLYFALQQIFGVSPS